MLDVEESSNKYEKVHKFFELTLVINYTKIAQVFFGIGIYAKQSLL